MNDVGKILDLIEDGSIAIRSAALARQLLLMVRDTSQDDASLINEAAHIESSIQRLALLDAIHRRQLFDSIPNSSVLPLIGLLLSEGCLDVQTAGVTVHFAKQSGLTEEQIVSAFESSSKQQ